MLMTRPITHLTGISMKSMVITFISIAISMTGRSALGAPASEKDFADPGDSCKNIRVGSTDGWRAHAECIASKLPSFDPKRRELFGEKYDPKKYLNCRYTKIENNSAGSTECEKFRLLRRLWPEYWPEGKVPVLRIPERSNESVFRAGMTAKQYFDALCKVEAGYFVYKTAESVEGFYLIRSWLKASTEELTDLWVLEDPYSHSEGNATAVEDYFVQPPYGPYQFIEVPRPISRDNLGKPYVRYFKDGPQGSRLFTYLTRNSSGGTRTDRTPYIVAEEPRDRVEARYGVLWRGISRSIDRENRIAGGDLFVLDLTTSDVLAVRRGFAMTYAPDSKRGPNWAVTKTCPPNNLGASDRAFVLRVLRPKQ
jgi:hypothetical protein